MKTRSTWIIPRKFERMKPVASGYREYPGDPETPEDSEGSEPESQMWPHHFHVSSDRVPHMEKVFSIVRQTYGWSPTDDLNDLDVNTVVWGKFVSVTLQALDDSDNLRSIKNPPLVSVDQLFRTSEKLINDQMEITGLSTIEWNEPMWRETSLLCDRPVHVMKSKTYVFADSVLCLGGISPVPIQAWRFKITWYLETRYLKDLNRIDGESMEFEWKNFPGFTTLTTLAVNQSKFKEGSSSCHCMERERGNRENCVANSVSVAAHAKKFPQGWWSFLGSGFEKKWYGTQTRRSMGQACWRHDAQLCWERASCISCQRCFRGELADSCKELSKDSRNQTEGEVFGIFGGTEFPNANAISQASTSLAQEHLLHEYERKFAELPDDQKLSKLSSDAGFVKEFGKGQFFITFEEESDGMQTVCREYTQPRDDKASRARGWIRGNTKIGPVLDVKDPRQGHYCIMDFMIESLFRDHTSHREWNQ